MKSLLLVQVYPTEGDKIDQQNNDTTHSLSLQSTHSLPPTPSVGYQQVEGEDDSYAHPYNS